jgi:hypothetical protein
VVLLLGQEFQQYVAAERHAGERERSAWKLGCDPIEGEREIRRFSRVIKPPSAIWLAAARAKDEKVRAPASPRCFVQQSLRIVRANRPFKSVQQQYAWCVRRPSKAVDFEEISVRSIPPLESRWRRTLSSKELSPKGLQVPAGDPPRGRIDYVTRHKDPDAFPMSYAADCEEQIEIGSADIRSEEKRGNAKSASLFRGAAHQDTFRQPYREAGIPG